MLSRLINAVKCTVGPRLYRINKEGSEEGRLYIPNTSESCGDNAVRSLTFLYSLGVYTSPIIIGVLYRRGYFAIDGIYYSLKVFALVGIILLSSLCLRGVGRACNPDYVTFISVLETAKKNFNRDAKRALLRYDFEFYAFPVDFRADSVEEEKSRKRTYLSHSFQNASIFKQIFSIPLTCLEYIIAHTFGIRLVYPGTIGILQIAMGSMLLQGRTKLVEEYGGERAKLITKDNNSVEVMVIDRRRNSTSPNAQILVICTEGNAGFYEVGITMTPLEAGYSVIGWNHPGFGGSTGVPFPEEEANAIDTVIQYAIHELHYDPSDIVLFAWSIGGYSATWAAMNYPDIKSVILDATFDNLVPLAVSRMPASWKLLVKRTVEHFMNLNNAEQLVRYSGPVLFIRRTNDEMISTNEQDLLSTNRGNDLLIGFLKHRYPRLVDERSTETLKKWLLCEKSEKAQLFEYLQVDRVYCSSLVSSYFQQHDRRFPCLLGEGLSSDDRIKLSLFLADLYMVDYNSSHCTPLPKQFFKLPWDPFLDNDFLQVHGEAFVKN